MILWRGTGIGGWAKRLPVVFPLRQNVSDLSDHEERYAEGVEVACTRQFKKNPDPSYIARVLDASEFRKDSSRLFFRPRSRDQLVVRSKMER